ncbi:MAG: inorganic pyrophosphatase [uncultured DHVE6 group euryarchaeote]|jgi:inorganic pyrophosphatase|nr:MAG: inorganic pyrophosphatase [uncultured DHVE6 group euryarchaeote]
MVNMWHDVGYGKRAPDEVNVIIEIPAGSKDKYELDKETGLIMLDRVLEVSMAYPGNYGFIPMTFCDDKDPLDVIILTHSPIHPGVLVKARPVAVLDMVDSGESDEKILAVPANDPRFDQIKDLKDVPKAFLDEIYHFFERYKDLRKGTVQLGKWGNAKLAKKVINDSIKLYDKEFK